MLKLIQLTDLHLFSDPEKRLNGSHCYQNLQAVLSDIKQQHADADLLLLTGDLSQDETLASYQQLNNLLADIALPVYYINGNHDDPEQASHGLIASNLHTNKHLVFENWQLILLNSRVAGQPHGHLSASERAFLQHCLTSQPNHHALVSVHHHSLPVGGTMDAIMLDNADALFTQLKQYPQAKVLLHGHVHQAFDSVHQQLRVLATPATCYQIANDDKKFVVASRRAGYRVINLLADGEIDTEVYFLNTDNRLN